MEEIKEETAYILHHLKIRPKFRDEKITEALSESIYSVLVEYRIEHNDIPFIYHFKPYITKSLFNEEDLWEIADLDQNYAKYKRISKSVNFFKSRQSDESVIQEIDLTLDLYEADDNILLQTRTYLAQKIAYFENSQKLPSYIRVEQSDFNKKMLEFYKQYFISPKRLADNLESSRRMYYPKIPESEPSECAKKMFEEHKDFNTICFDSVIFRYASTDIAMHPILFYYFKKKF